MKKKILSILLIATITITGLFAYTVNTPNKNAILNASATHIPYAFTIQYGMLGDAYYSAATATETISLDSFDVQETASSFLIRTSARGNESMDLVVEAVVTTGAFTNTNDVASTSFPFIEDTSSSFANPRTGEEQFYTPQSQTASGIYLEPSIGTYTREIDAGSHAAGTVIAAFRLSLKSNNTVGAGTYISTTLVEVSAN